MKTGKLLLANIQVWSRRITNDPESIPPQYIKELKMERHGINQ